MRILVTGVAGFIGAHTAKTLLARGDEVIGIDNFNPYYDLALKRARLDNIKGDSRFEFEAIDLTNKGELSRLYQRVRPDRIIHLAAQPGVRYSLENPQAYVDANITGFLNVLECARDHGTEHLVYASSSSVYGAHANMPYSVHHSVDHAVSLYAATKKANELMAHTYAHLFAIPCTGLRFFTVYGPWGRPDMAPFIFTRKIIAGEEIQLFNYGQHSRDFTYVDDIVEGVIRVTDRIANPNPDWDPANPDPATSNAPYRVYNIGSNNPTPLLRFIDVLENTLGIEAKRTLLPIQPGDVEQTYADVDALVGDVGYQPSTKIEDGVAAFVSWYKDYYNHADIAHNLA